jgi:hypothetical protein
VDSFVGRKLSGVGINGTEDGLSNTEYAADKRPDAFGQEGPFRDYSHSEYDHAE